MISSSNDDPSEKYPLLSSIKALNLLFSISYVGFDKSDIKIFVFKYFVHVNLIIYTIYKIYKKVKKACKLRKNFVNINLQNLQN